MRRGGGGGEEEILQFSQIHHVQII